MCNNHKAANLAGIDPAGDPDTAVQLFHPRNDSWSDHFRWRGPVLEGITPTGRATVDLLQINLPWRVEMREWLIEAELFPPADSATGP